MKGLVRNLSKGSAVIVATLLALGSAQANSNGLGELQRYNELGFTSEADMESYFSISDVGVVEVELTPGHFQTTPNVNIEMPKAKANTDMVISPADVIAIFTDPTSMQAWVVLGMKIWQVVLNNQPVANVSTQRISVLPQAQMDWTQMSGWKAPAARTYEVYARNLFGMKVMSNKYTIAYNHGGQHNGQGAFLANATIIPTRVSVLPGFELDSQVEVGNAVNVGTMESPVAAIDLQMKWRMKSVLRLLEGVNSFFIDGNGTFTAVNQQD